MDSGNTLIDSWVLLSFKLDIITLYCFWLRSKYVHNSSHESCYANGDIGIKSSKLTGFVNNVNYSKSVWSKPCTLLLSFLNKHHIIPVIWNKSKPNRLFHFHLIIHVLNNKSIYCVFDRYFLFQFYQHPCTSFLKMHL